MEKFTFIEPHLHFDDAQFGPSRIGSDDEETETGTAADVDVDAGRSGAGPRVGRLIVASVAFSVIAAVVARRLFGDDGDGGEQAPLDLDVEADAPAPGQ